MSGFSRAMAERTLKNKSESQLGLQLEKGGRTRSAPGRRSPKPPAPGPLARITPATCWESFLFLSLGIQ